MTQVNCFHKIQVLCKNLVVNRKVKKNMKILKKLKNEQVCFRVQVQLACLIKIRVLFQQIKKAKLMKKIAIGINNKKKRK